MTGHNLKIESVPLSRRQIRDIYDFLSSIYDYLTSFERSANSAALEIACIPRGGRILEVGIGTGRTIRELASRAGKEGQVYGTDISLGMIAKSNHIMEKHGLSQRVALNLGDAEHLPYQENSFDFVLSSHMLDLIDTPQIPQVLGEFKRILKVGGSLIVVNMSKAEDSSLCRIYEWMYRRNSYLLGGCRPILAKPMMEDAGFENVNRKSVKVGYVMPIEIVWGQKLS